VIFNSDDLFVCLEEWSILGWCMLIAILDKNKRQNEKKNWKKGGEKL